MTASPLISVVLPCLNEEESIGNVLQTVKAVFKEQQLDGEIIVCDNGSIDQSAVIAREAGVIVVEEPRRGYGSAYLTGFSRARGRYLVMGDCDGTYNFLLIPTFLNALQKEGFDFVTGSRYLGENDQAIPFLHRYLGNPLLTWILNTLFGCRYTDVYCGFRAFTRDCYAKICPISLGMEFNLELAINASLARFKIKEIPIILSPRQGKSKLRTMHGGWRSLRMMLLYCPNKLFLYPGFLFFAAGIGLEILTAGKWLTYQGRSFAMATAFCGSVACIIGFKLLGLGLHAKTYSWSNRFERDNPALARFYSTFTLEAGIALGSTSVLAGLIVFGVLIWRWVKSDLLPLPHPELAVLAGTLLIIGAETIFTSFFVSAMSMDKRNPALSVAPHIK